MTSGVVHFVHRALVAGVVVDHICSNIEIEMCNNREQRYNKYQGLKTPPRRPLSVTTRGGARGHQRWGACNFRNFEASHTYLCIKHFHSI